MVYGSYFFNEKPVADAVYRFKHEGERNIAELSAADIAEYIKVDNTTIPDFIVPVPMGRRKQISRGHNQAELFGKSLSKVLGYRCVGIYCSSMIQRTNNINTRKRNARNV